MCYFVNSTAQIFSKLIYGLYFQKSSHQRVNYQQLNFIFYLSFFFIVFFKKTMIWEVEKMIWEVEKMIWEVKKMIWEVKKMIWEVKKWSEKLKMIWEVEEIIWEIEKTKTKVISLFVNTFILILFNKLLFNVYRIGNDLIKSWNSNL